MKGLRSDIKEVNRSQQTIITMLENLQGDKYVGKISFSEKYNLQLPLQTLEDLQNLEKQITTDEECCNSFVCLFYYIILLSCICILQYVKILRKCFATYLFVPLL